MNPDFKELEQICRNIERAIHRIPHKAAVIAVNFTKQRFIKKDWLDTTSRPWLKTKKRKGSTLIKSGRLKRSIRHIHIGADYAIIGTDVPYARIHNDGGTIQGTEQVRAHRRRSHKRKAHTRLGKRIKPSAVREHTVRSYRRAYKRTLPSRQFIGQSRNLDDQLTNMIQTEIRQAINL